VIHSNSFIQISSFKTTNTTNGLQAERLQLRGVGITVLMSQDVSKVVSHAA
jgi:hypothetical protein